ncbi:hypothetical protein C8J27_1134 [Rhodobacter aestuarii]|uniref:Uncharacterized protein n=1 Tax=Rhodobacter aestuarii TaxID=453582 RepID=A0A1N7QAN4_9RHOB|nr:hypothetical protein [Rhodobacter aestuarii]PTV93639.1 hypothetical protein C8J27_1134 [Rhodobacter aestuarii]SIT19940.1 hypothetical protein SAMN05421580_1154 [Rhodobacter aestuarii]
MRQLDVCDLQLGPFSSFPELQLSAAHAQNPTAGNGPRTKPLRGIGALGGCSFGNDMNVVHLAAGLSA